MSDVPDVAVALIVIVVCLVFGGFVYYIVRRRRKQNHDSQPHKGPQLHDSQQIHQLPHKGPQSDVVNRMHIIDNINDPNDPASDMKKAKHDSFLEIERNAWLRHNEILRQEGKSRWTLEQFRKFSNAKADARMIF